MELVVPTRTGTIRFQNRQFWFVKFGNQNRIIQGQFDLKPMNRRASSILVSAWLDYGLVLVQTELWLGIDFHLFFKKNIGK